jgi:ABC-2 type transport system permease protein
MVSREILANLIRKEVLVKYKSSVLGVAWSMLNPILYLAVFSFVFTFVLKARVPDFAVYLLSGLLAWSLFSTSLGLGVKAVVDNANLVTKVYFPREILPLASVGASLVDFVLQAAVLVAFMIVFRAGHFGTNLLLLPLAMLALLTFTSAVAMWVAALNVRYRDTQHLLSLALLVWFWLTPVVYPSATIADFTHRHVLGVSMFHLFLLNPMGDIVMGFQRALYGVVSPVTIDAAGHRVVNPVLLPVSVEWMAWLLCAVTVGSMILLALAWRSFFHLSGDFAEEL